MIYLDHNATTPCDRRVVEAMLPWLTEQFGNPHSSSHELGREAARAIDSAVDAMAELVDAPADSVLITSGATESNNLAIRGVCQHPRQKRTHFVTTTIEHPAVQDVAAQIEREGIRVTRVGVDRQGRVDLDALAEAVDDRTALVSVMWANNEVGTIAQIARIAEICHERGALLHSDATQAVGRLDVRVRTADVDLLSASAHKFYGPKGVGLLIAGNSRRRVRLRPQIVGGGQQRGIRAGTMNPAGIVAMASALQIAVASREHDRCHTRRLRDRLYARLARAIEGVSLNGPPLDSPDRLAGNLNLTLPVIEGAAWMSAVPDVAFSSGSACSSVEDRPSPVLRAMGLSESEARRSVRFGLGRFNTEAEIDEAAATLIDAYQRLGNQYA